MYRNNSYDQSLAREFKNPKFAQEYLLNLVNDKDEPMSIEEALRFIIPKIGVSEFAKIIDKNISDVDKFLRKERNLKPDTLIDYLKPFKLQIKMSLEKKAA